MSAYPPFDGIRKIAVLAPVALGDFIFTLPALQSLKRTYPDAQLVLLALPWIERFLAGRPGPVDRVIVIPHPRGVHAPPDQQPDEATLDRYFESMQREGFDLALQLYGGGRQSNAFLLRLGARHTAGRRTGEAPAPARWLPYRHYQHEVVRHLETVALVGADATYVPPQLSLIPRDRAELQQVGPLPGARYAVIHPGASDPRRRWDPASFAAVARELQARGIGIVLTGQRSEADVLDRLASSLDQAPLVLCDRLSTGALAALLAGACVLVSNDTGPAHLARAVDTPTVTIYWGPNVINAGPLHQARHRAALSWQMRCPVCDHDYGDPYPYVGRDCGHTVSLVDQVPVEEVVVGALEVCGG
ncbi:glycosyltransferase family 9 protein [Caldimonas brevitalea]|uniref:Glycosyl transferase n=1 Tax=Caldimonas brevitalea TaxID=413882 RepID=A0A0G3BJR2_9BURK|nr:glycosyltransferase family 9 protein [Caldimonas brevitalea]AKJ28228.1 glycosyl transferase [Caldimonas brevitalea]